MEDKARMPTDAERRPPGSDQPRQRKPKPERNTRGDATLPDSPATSPTKPKEARPTMAAAAPSAPHTPAAPPLPAAPAALTTPAPLIQPKREIESRRVPPPAQPDSAAAYASHIDVDALTKNFARLVEEGG